MTKRDETTRCEFIKQVGAGAVAVSGPVSAGNRLDASRQAPAMAKARLIGANDRINVGFVACGGRMNTHIRRVMEWNKERGDVQAVAVNDIWDKRKQRAREATWIDQPSHASREASAIAIDLTASHFPQSPAPRHNPEPVARCRATNVWMERCRLRQRTD